MNLSKISLKKALLIIIFFEFVLFLIIFFYPNLKDLKGRTPFVENVAAFSNQGQSNLELPLRLKIPSINIDTSIEYLGLTSDGAMDVPKGPTDVAWFDLGPRPGEVGSAVIAGHFGWKDGIPAVFDNLYKLQKGDKIYVESQKGTVITFVVRESKIYDSEANVESVFNSSDGKAHLNLVTCTGVWNVIEKSRSERLVIFTDKE
jgi:sortase A